MTRLGRWLSTRSWEKVRRDLTARHEILFDLSKRLKDKKLENHLSLAATDVFVEKAQQTLTWRGRMLAAAGAFAALIALACFVVPAVYLMRTPLSATLQGYSVNNGYLLTLLILKASTASGAIIAAAVFSIHLAKAFFHEATILYNRRHALRFGRLYVYLAEGRTDLESLERAFKWSDEFSTAFSNIQPEGFAPQSVVKSAGEVAGKAVEGTASVLGGAAEGLRGRKS